MNVSWSRTGLLSTMALMAVAPLCVLHAADVKGARVGGDQDHTRVVLDVSGPVTYKVRQEGGQLVVDIDHSAIAGDFSAPSARGLYKGMATSVQGDGVRLTARVASAGDVKSFLLSPGGDSGYRLVIDLYPGRGGDTPAPRAVAATTPMPAPASSAASAEDDDAPVAVAAVATPSPVRSPAKSGLNPTQSGMVSTRAAAAMLKGERKVVIAIDAGHGGQDPGAHGPDGTLEKNVTLAVARQLADQINRQPGMRAVLTRDADFFIPLQQRYKIARDNNADLFVSIHADAYATGDAKGSSVWVLSPRGKTNEAARWLADGQNRADLIGGVTLDDKSDDLAAVLLDLQQGYSMQASETVANNVLHALGDIGPTHRGYVERANFVVLRSPDVPSILVETAFISNPVEEGKLRDPVHQAKLAEAVMNGLRSYFESTPPPGTWFAAQAARRGGSDDAAPAPQVVSVAKFSDDDGTSASSSSRDMHRVARGESLRSIARQYGVSVSALKSANRISSDSAVRVGMMLAIPTS